MLKQRASLARYLAVSFVTLFSGFASSAAQVTPVLQNCRVAGTNFLFDLVAWPGDYIIEASTNTAGAWIPEMTITVNRARVVNVALPFTGQKALFFQAMGATPSDGMGCLAQFQTLGSTFEPDIGCDNGPPQQFQWIWSDATSSSNYPVASKDFGTPGARIQGLLANPMTSVTSINLGFDGSDGGDSTPLSYWPMQSVSAVRFPFPLPGLRYWASSYNPITNTLDFSGFTNLEIIECYWCTNLQHVVVTNLPALRRACLKSCQLQELDLSGNLEFQDLRGSLNAYTNIIVGRGTGPKIWHWCVGGNPQLTQQFADILTNFYSLQELYLWDDNQQGILTTGSTNLSDLWAWDNHFTGADFAGQRSLANCQIYNNALTNLVLAGCINLLNLDAHNNALPDLALAGCGALQCVDVSENLLTNLDLSACTGLQSLDAHSNRLPAGALDEVLAFLDDWASGLTNVDLTDNAQVPSPIGYSHYMSLTNRGVRAFVDWPTP